MQQGYTVIGTKDAATPTCASQTLNYASKAFNATYNRINTPGVAITSIACAAMIIAAAFTEDLNLAGYALYTLALAPFINALFEARSSENTVGTITNGAAGSARILAFISTAVCYGLVNAGHQLKIPEGASIPLKTLLGVGSVALNTWLNMDAAEGTVKKLPELPRYVYNMSTLEHVAFWPSVVVSLALSLAGSTPMMTAVVDSAEKLGAPYELLKASNGLLFMVDGLLLMHPLIMRGFIAFAQWIQNLCKKPSEIEELENTTKTLGSIVGNADKLPRFIRHTRAKTTDGSETISTDQIREVIKNMTEMQGDSYCSALFYKTTAGAFVLGINMAFVYITAAEITLVGNYEQLGFIAEIPKGLLALLDAMKLNIPAGDTSVSALALNSGNFFFPMVGGYASLLSMLKVIGDYKMLTPTSTTINIISAIFGLLSIGTVLAMGEGMPLAYLAALSPFFLNTSAAPQEMWRFVAPTAETKAQNEAIEAFGTAIKEAKSTYTSTKNETAYKIAIEVALTTVVKSLMQTLTIPGSSSSATMESITPTPTAPVGSINDSGEPGERTALLLGTYQGYHSAVSPAAEP